MEEKWEAHPTRKNIFINKDDGLMYRKTKVGSFQMIVQKMTELQELESFRRMAGTVAVTSRTRGKEGLQSEQIPDEDHT